MTHYWTDISLSDLSLKISSASNAVVKNVPLKIYCWDRFVFQSLEIWKKSAFAFIRHVLDVTELRFIWHLSQKAFLSDGSESNIEFGKMIFIKYEPATLNASETLFYFLAILWSTQSFWNAGLIRKEGKDKWNPTACVWSLRNTVSLESSRGSGFLLEIEGVFCAMHCMREVIAFSALMPLLCACAVCCY